MLIQETAAKQAQAQAIKPSRPLPELRKDIYQLTDRLRAVTEQLSVHADNLFGSSPCADNCVEKEAPAEGEIGGIRQAMDALRDAVARVENEASRNTGLA